VLDDLRQRLGYRAALRAARQRTVHDWPVPPPDRKVLVLLPHEEGDLRAAWRFVQTIDEPRGHLVPAITADRVPYTPDAFAAGVATVGERARDWRGLPRRAEAQKLWSDKLHVALDLTPGFDLAAAYLVGASPARFRVGLYSAEGEPFYDLLIAPTGGYEAALTALRGYLAAIEPPVLSFNVER